MREGQVQRVPMALRRRLRFWLVRRLDPRLKRFVKRNLKRLPGRQLQTSHAPEKIPNAYLETTAVLLKPGNVVRVRSLSEIAATLDSKGRLRGCKFMPEMAQYCGSVQRVFKPVERFLNEFDYTIRQSKGLVLLENLFCNGVAEAGRCDRSCLYFWRVEWLELVEASQDV